MPPGMIFPVLWIILSWKIAWSMKNNHPSSKRNKRLLEISKRVPKPRTWYEVQITIFFLLFIFIKWDDSYWHRHSHPQTQLWRTKLWKYYHRPILIATSTNRVQHWWRKLAPCKESTPHNIVIDLQITCLLTTLSTQGNEDERLKMSTGFGGASLK